MNISKLYDPVFFARYVLNFHPFDYQSKLLLDKSKRICAVMGRQTGKSTTIAAKAVHFAITNPNTVTLIVSPTLRQSLLLFEKILAFSNKIRSSIAYTNQTKIRFKNNSTIIALPCSGSMLRGYTASLLILDEAAFIPKDVINNVLMPMISTTDGSVWMLSTPYSKDHPFYKAFIDKEWSVHKVPSIMNPLIKSEFLEEQRRFVGEFTFMQEYNAEFIDDEDTFLPSSLIQRCIDVIDDHYKNNIYAGFDPGGRSDPAALVIISVDAYYRLIYKKSWHGIDYSIINNEVVELCKVNNVSKLCIDQTGLGNPITEVISKMFGYDKVSGITLTMSLKEEILLNLRLLFEEGKIRIPADQELLSSLSCISYKKKTIGYKFEHSYGTHDDLAYALALACWIAKKDSNGVVINI